MKFSFLLFCLINYIGLASGQDNYAILTLLNHGCALNTGQTCSTAEWDAITSTIDSAALIRRNLRQHHRQLASPYFCGTVCKYFARGTCYLVYPSCSNRRRRRFLRDDQEPQDTPKESDERMHDFRELSNSMDCLTKVNNIKSDLDALTPTLSEDCQALVNSTRDFVCTEVHVIKSWSLWNAIDDTIIMPNFGDGGSLCRSTEFNIEAVVDDEDRQNYIEKISFVVTGPNNFYHTHTERRGHYMMFGNFGDDMLGETFESLGDYTVTATPNDDPGLSRTFTFTLNDC